MATNLVIVESPAKVKTIKKFLGKNYEVMASQGHVRDLPKSQLGFDPEHGYEPKYITIRGKGEILAALRKEAKKADKIYLATDPDREGEAIAWHLTQAVNMDGKKVYRITFNEITKNAVKEAIKNPREIDMNLVDAQQARRMLDRMVGYRISPILWSKVKRGLSAGRVQSVALRIIADREEEIDAFVPEEYWTLDADIMAEGGRKPIQAHFFGRGSEKMTLKTKSQTDAVKEAVMKEDFVVAGVKKSERVKKAPLPFTTSTLQQEASKLLNFSTQKTMGVAQQLYEGVDIKGNGTVGVITYLRTDSTRVSEEALKSAGEYIAANYGVRYAAAGQARSGGGRNVQDAHEAIRPTDVSRTPALLKDSLTRDQFRLYQLIWKRFVASRMTEAVYDAFSVKLDAGGYRFAASASALVFDGFMCVYEGEDEKDGDVKLLKDITRDTKVTLAGLSGAQHYTQPPAHYTEASLVKTLEELGIGRPSTYAPTITTIIARRYVTKEKKNLYLTELGEVVNDIMKQAFPSIVETDFTANMEGLLDCVEAGTVNWKTVVENFYPDLEKAVVEAESTLDKVDIEDEVTDVVCEECGRNMVVKYGRHGKFLACPGFPDCRNTKPYLEKTGVKCPVCGGEILIKKTQKGRRYYGCENSKECGFMTWQRPSAQKCPKCGGYMLEKGRKLVCADKGCGYMEDKK